MKSRFLVLLFLITLVLLPQNVFAASPALLGKFGFWSAYSATEGNQQVCYMSVTSRPPKTSKPKRGDITMMITHRPFENSKDVFSYTAGMILKPASELTVKVGSKNFNLFTQDDTAWSRDSATDRALVAALRSGNEAKVIGISSKGYKILDKVNLIGMSKAYESISKACGIAVEALPKPKPSSIPPKKPNASKRKF